MKFKTCSKCKQQKPLDDFHKDKRGVSGRRSHCKNCCPKAAKQQYCVCCKQSKRRVDFPKGKTKCKECLDNDGKQYCGKCGKLKHFEEFAACVRRRNGRHPICKKCQKPKWQEYYQKDPRGIAKTTRDRYAANRLRYRKAATMRRFKLTEDEYDKVHSRDLCQVCKKPETKTRNGKVTRLAIAHCHETGKVRGLLCNLCNQGLRSFKDNPSVLRAAAKYLEKHK